ncbi:MAG: hypothetical protein R2822_27280 [Spirosomataceae bacterium]
MKAFVFASQEREGFLPAAQAFRAYLRRIGYEVTDTSFAVNSSVDAEERNAIAAQLVQTTGNFDLIAYFGHGGSNSLISADMTVAQFCNIFGRRVNRGVKIILYACSTGSPGGFAQQVSRRLAGSTVTAHTTAEDATRNPAVVQYPDPHRHPNQHYIVHPNSLLWPAWVRKLLESQGGLMYWREYPFRCIEDIALELYEYVLQHDAVMRTEALAYRDQEESGRGASRLGLRYAQVTSRALLFGKYGRVPEARRGESPRAQRIRRQQEAETGRVMNGRESVRGNYSITRYCIQLWTYTSC